MYPFIFFSISAICFFGGLISAIMALTGNPTDSMEHWKNAAIYGGLAPLAMFASIFTFWNSGSNNAGNDETKVERKRRLKQQKQNARELGMHSVIQGIFIGIGSSLVLLLRGLNPMLAVAVGAGCILLGILILFISLSKTATNLSAMIGRAFFVLLVGLQVALAFVTLVMVVIIQMGLLETT